MLTYYIIILRVISIQLYDIIDSNQGYDFMVLK